MASCFTRKLLEKIEATGATGPRLGPGPFLRALRKTHTEPHGARGRGRLVGVSVVKRLKSLRLWCI